MAVPQLRHEIIDLDDLDEVLVRPYLRVSDDKSKVMRSPAEQLAEIDEVIERKRRWRRAEGAPYTDEGSASRHKRKERASFEELLADLRNGTFGAHILALWEASRGSREPAEWEVLLELTERLGVHFYVVSNGRTYNPAIASDRRDLRLEAVHAAYESDKTSERTRRASTADAAAGAFGGGRRPYGYEKDGITANADEKAIVRECTDRVLAGETVRSIADDLNRRNIPTAGGNQWHPGPLANLLRSERIVGRCVHHGEVVKVDAWDALIDEVTHKRVVAVLAARTPAGRRGRTPWLLTGLLRCGRCDAALVSNTDIGGVRRYCCRKGVGYKGCGRLAIRALEVEVLLGELLVERAAGVRAANAAALDDSDEQADLDEIAVLRSEAAEDRANGLARSAYNELIAALDRRQAAVHERLAAKVQTGAVYDLIEDLDGASFAALPVKERRRRLALLIDHVTVGPATTIGSNRFEPERVDAPGRIAWRL